MYNYNKTNYKQQVEIMRRCTADALDGSDIWIWDAGCEQWLETLFFSHHDITEIANHANCPETEIMRKIQELDLYNRYNSLPFQQRYGDGESTPETPKDDLFSSDSYIRAIEQMRRATPTFDREQFTWSEEKSDLLDRMFCTSVGITAMALALGCTEPMVMEQILKENLYQSMDFPLFSYCY